MAFIDIEGLRDVASHLRSVPDDLDSARIAGAAELAKLDLWADRGTFATVLDGQAIWAAELATDLELRATTMEVAESSISGLAFFGAGFSGGAAYSLRETVDDALEQIEDLLRTDGTKIIFWSKGDTDVSREEMLGVAEVLEGLSGIELWSLFQRMDEDLLAKLLDEADDNGIAGWRLDQLFEHLALNAGAAALGRVVLLSDGETRDGLVGAIAAHSNGLVQKWVFADVVDHLDADGDHPAVAVALFEAMTPAYRRLALAQLDHRGGFGDFMTALVEHEEGTSGGTFGALGGGSPTLTNEYDATLLVQFLESVAALEDPDLKAQVFVASVDLLADPLRDASENLILHAGGFSRSTHRFEGETGKEALSALAELLVSDADGVFDALRLDVDYRGQSTSDYFRELLRAPGNRGDIHGEPLSHDGAVLANQILAELYGPDLTAAERAEFFQAVEATSGGTDDYVNASRLGFFAGTLSSGLDDLGTADDEEWTAIGIILGAAGLVDPTKLSSSLKLFESTFSEISSEIQDHSIEQLEIEYRAFEHALVDQIVPRTVQGYLFDGDAADEFFNTYDRVGGLVVD